MEEIFHGVSWHYGAASVESSEAEGDPRLLLMISNAPPSHSICPEQKFISSSCLCGKKRATCPRMRLHLSRRDVRRYVVMDNYQIGEIEENVHAVSWQQKSRVVKGRGTPGQLLAPHKGNAPPSHSKCPHVQQGTVLAAFVAKSEQLVHGCNFICSLEKLEGM